MSKVDACYSYHIFLYPFIIKGEKSWFKSHLDDSRHWKDRNSADSGENFMDAMDDFMVGQYFNQEARRLFLNKENGMRYCYDAAVVQQIRYIIGFTEGENLKKEYALPVDDIELFLFHGEVGILKFSVRNTVASTLSEIKYINDYGRRILLPFLPRDSEGNFSVTGKILCADYLGMAWKDDRHFVKSFRDDLRQWKGISEADYKAPDFLYGILAGELGDARSSYGKTEKFKALDRPEGDVKGRAILPVLDDRMYLCSLICSKRLEMIAKKWERISECPRAERLIYSLAFVDPKDATCQNAAMRKKLLDAAIYTRWSDWGTLYSVTHNGLLCMTSKNPPADSVIRPFLKEYYLIAVLILAQKISLENFSLRAAEKSPGTEKKGLIPEQQVQDIIQLHESYVSWANQEYLLEVTEQEQGVDLYHLLQEQMGLLPYMNRLREQLQGLYSVANVSQGTDLSRKGTKYATIAAIWAVCAVFVDITLNTPNFFSGDLPEGWSDGMKSFIFSTLFIGGVLTIAVRESREK